MKLPILEFELGSDTISDGFSQTEMQLWDNCSEKWYLGYNLRLRAKGKLTWALFYGTWIHATLEEFYASRGKRWSWNPTIDRKLLVSPQQRQDYEYWSRLGEIQMQMYASYYKQDHKIIELWQGQVEHKVELEFEGVLLRAKLDLFALLLKRWGVWDHKTSARIDANIVDGWNFRLQFMFYEWMAWKIFKEIPHYMMINIIRKPQLKRGINEGLDAFLQRVQTDMAVRTEFYLQRIKLTRVKGDLQWFEHRVLRPKIERIKFLLSPKTPEAIKIAFFRNQNTDYCQAYGKRCEFIPICQKGLDYERLAYETRPAKHEELDTDD